MAKDEELKIAIKIDDELMSLVQDILNGKMVVSTNKKKMYQLAYHMRPLRKENRLIVARDSVTKETAIFLNGVKPRTERKPHVFGGYLLEIIFPSLRKKDRPKSDLITRVQ